MRRAEERSGARSALGGWVVTLTALSRGLRKELEHPEFPFEFPDTTTGYQALGYIKDAWMRAKREPKDLANEVREFLALAYEYCLADLRDCPALGERWDRIRPKAMVFTEQKKWLPLGQSSKGIYFDDLEDRRFLPSKSEMQTAASAHLGKTADQQSRTAEALGLTPLSSVMKVDWVEGTVVEVSEWEPRFRTICELLAYVKASGERAGSAEAASQTMGLPKLRRLDKLEATVRMATEEPKTVSVNARWEAETSFLTVAGAPSEFAPDAAGQTLSSFSFEQNNDLATHLTVMFAVIDRGSEFRASAEQFRERFASEYELPQELGKRVVREHTKRTGKEPDPSPAKGTDETKDPSYDVNRASAEPAALAKKLEKGTCPPYPPIAEGSDRRFS